MNGHEYIAPSWRCIHCGVSAGALIASSFRCEPKPESEREPAKEVDFLDINRGFAS